MEKEDEGGSTPGLQAGCGAATMGGAQEEPEAETEAEARVVKGSA